MDDKFKIPNIPIVHVPQYRPVNGVQKGPAGGDRSTRDQTKTKSTTSKQQTVQTVPSAKVQPASSLPQPLNKLCPACSAIVISYLQPLQQYINVVINLAQAPAADSVSQSTPSATPAPSIPEPPQILSLLNASKTTDEEVAKSDREEITTKESQQLPPQHTVQEQVAPPQAARSYAEAARAEPRRDAYDSNAPRQQPDAGRQRTDDRSAGQDTRRETKPERTQPPHEQRAPPKAAPQPQVSVGQPQQRQQQQPPPPPQPQPQPQSQPQPQPPAKIETRYVEHNQSSDVVQRQEYRDTKGEDVTTEVQQAPSDQTWLPRAENVTEEFVYENITIPDVESDEQPFAFVTIAYSNISCGMYNRVLARVSHCQPLVSERDPSGELTAAH